MPSSVGIAILGGGIFISDGESKRNYIERTSQANPISSSYTWSCTEQITYRSERHLVSIYQVCRESRASRRDERLYGCRCLQRRQVGKSRPTTSKARRRGGHHRPSDRLSICCDTKSTGGRQTCVVGEASRSGCSQSEGVGRGVRAEVQTKRSSELFIFLLIYSHAD